MSSDGVWCRRAKWSVNSLVGLLCVLDGNFRTFVCDIWMRRMFGQRTVTEVNTYC